MKNILGNGKVASYPLLFGMLFFSVTARSDEFVWTNAKGDGDWAEAGNYTKGGDVAKDPPGEADVVCVPDGTTVILDYDVNDPKKKSSCETFASVRQIRPMGGNVRIEMTVPEEKELPLGCAVTYGLDANKIVCQGALVKKGDGVLSFASVGSVTKKDGSTTYDYGYALGALDVCEGTLKLPQVTGMTTSYYFSYGRIDVRDGATLFTAKTGRTHVMDVKASGLFTEVGSLVTNDNTSASYLQTYAFGELKGKVAGAISIYGRGRVFLRGTENEMTGAISLWYNKGELASGDEGVLGVAKFGLKAVDKVSTPSSIGYAEEIVMRDRCGGLLYLGEGETTDKDFILWGNEDYPGFIDGGEVGGLVWTGNWAMRKASDKDWVMKRIVLDGSNAVPCVMSGKILCADGKVATNCTFRVTKRGTGEWRLLHNGASDLRGVVAVAEGALGFDTLAEKGVNSALGKSTVLQRDMANVPVDPLYAVDYAFLLGGGATRGDLVYLGTTNCLSTTRRFSVNGTGAIVNNGTGRLFLADVNVLADAPHGTLVLGGTNALDNVVDCIADGNAGTLSVVKEGSGTWRLGTNCTFTGTLDVKAGALRIGHPQYVYYRWTIKQTFVEENELNQTGSAYRKIGLRNFGLFDETGADRVQGLSDEGEWTSYPLSTTVSSYRGFDYSYGSAGFFANTATNLQLQAGHARLTGANGTKAAYNNFGEGDDNTITPLFGHREELMTFWRRAMKNDIPRTTNDASWTVLTMRPTSGTPITSWDYVTGYSGDSTWQQAKVSLLEASVDGVSWDELDALDLASKPSATDWVGAGTAYEAGYETHLGGRAISPWSTNAVAFAASSVSVAANASLVAQTGRPLAVDKIAVDASGMGELKGFALSENGVIDIVNAPARGSFEVSADLSGVSLPMTYSFLVNGQQSKRSVALSQDRKKIVVSSKGLLLIFR